MDATEDIAKVSSDGEPHEILTIVAVSSGILVAVAILIVLRINLRGSQRRDGLQKRRFSLFSVRGSVDISRKTEIYTIDSHRSSCETNITIDDNDKYLYIPGITTISM
ncbi:uncharacterized protein LOC129808112 [Phlebotomus papatasi]|uniref:uncharacterized protein LOC129808112 n=1 Tax=Phlebotomus papatasi TaxID=29031 RepID=UPI002483DDBD|nr:uncharacterized protein LOC129808112 [Phlebotomus papatasi]